MTQKNDTKKYEGSVQTKIQKKNTTETETSDNNSNNKNDNIGELFTEVHHQHDGVPGVSQELRTSYQKRWTLGRPSIIIEV